MRKYLFLLPLLLSGIFCFAQTITFSGSTTLCPSGSLMLTVAQPNPIPAFQWQKDGTNIAGAITNTYTAVSAGSYRVILTLGGNSDTSNTVAISNITNPTPSFTFPSAINCSNTPITFSNTSVSGLTFEWDFDDTNSGSNNSSTQANPTHTFIGIPGIGNQSFNVILTARNSFGCIGSTNRIITTKKLPGTQLSGPSLTTYNGIRYFRRCSSNPSEVFNFTNASSTIADNTNYKIKWGDSNPDSSFLLFNGVISHTYSVGTYSLLFIVSGNGCIDTGRYNIFVGTNPGIGLNIPPEGTVICSGTSLTFPVTGTSQNTPGTVYTVTFNDGTPPLNFNHPMPSQVTHAFNLSSCNFTTQTSPSYTNSFSATIQASNPCLTSAANVAPIYVSSKPTPDFSISPNDTVCVNTTTSFTNITPSNNYINAPNCEEGKFVWKISPSTGWAISTGNLGSDNGSSDPDSWSILSTSIIGLNFTQSGVYTISLKVGNPACGKDSVIKTICVNSIPTAAFSINQSIGCAPLAVNTNNTTVANNCGNNTYTWSVSYMATIGCLPDISDFTFTGGTNSASTSPKFQFNNPGVYIISLVATAPGGTCASVPFIQTVTVKGKPKASINATSSICKGESITPTVTTDCYIDAATTYAWTFTGGNPATSNSNPPGSITYNTSGNYNIAVDITNECGVTTATKPIAVNDVTIAAAGSSQNICGSVVTMAANAATTGTGEWTKTGGPASYLITNSSSPTTTITNLTTGTYTFRWTIANGNCTSQSDVTIIISAGASVANAGTDQNLCLSNSTTLNANTPVVGTGTWSQVSGPAATIATPANATTSISGLVPGTYVFRWTITFSNCTPNTDDVQVIIYNNPSAANAGTDQTICASAVTLTGNIPAIGNGTWSQIGSTPAPASILNVASASTSVSGLINPGVYKFVWTITNGPCASTKDTVEITVTEVSTTANAGTDINSCIGSTVTLAGNTATVGNGVWAIVSGPAGAVITNSSVSNTSVTGMAVGTYVLRWTITNGNCPPSSDDVQVIIYDNPSAANAGTDQTICASSVTLTGNAPAIGSGAWSQLAGGPNVATITTASSSSPFVTGLIPGIYKFKWTISNGPCLTKQDTVEINVTEVATTADAGTDIRQCAVSSVTLAGNTATVGIGVWSYVSGPAGYSITSISSPTTTVTGLVPGIYIFRWTITNGNCPASSDDVQVIVDENVTVANAGPAQNKCGVSVTMAANTPIVGTGQWSIVSGPAGASIANSALSATTINDLVPGNYVFKWTITNGSCSSSSDVAVTIFAGASAAVAGTDQDLCLATTTTLNAVTPIVGTGEWSQVSGPNTAVIVNSSGNTTAINSLIPGTYIFRWTVSYSNCTPNTDEVQVMIYNNPTVSAAGLDQIICAASTSFAANGPSIGSGAWSQIAGPSTATVADINSASSSVSDLIPGLYRFKWTISSGPCIASEDIVEINVSAIATTANAGVDTVYCNLPSINLTANVAMVGTGLWSFISGPNTASITTPGLNATSVTGLIPGTYIFRWTITSGVCPPSIDDVEIRILNSLQNTITAPVDTICAGQQAVINGALPTGGTGFYFYQWQQSADGISWVDIAGETNQNLSIVLNTTTFFQRKVTSLPCESFSNTIKIFVQPGITNNLILDNDSICINTAASLLTGSTPTGGDGIYAYQWQQSTNGGTSWNDIAGERGINYNPGILIQTTQYRRLVSTALCSGPQSDISNLVTITINPDSKAIFTASDTEDCNPFDLNTVISVTHLPDSNGAYTWYADNSFIGSTTDGTFTGYTMNTPGDTVDIKLITESQFGCKPDSIQIQFVTIRASVATFTKDTTGGCGPLTVNFTNTSNIINNTIQFFWDFGNGITSTDAQPQPVTFVQSPDYRDSVYQVSLKAYNGCDTTTWRDSVKIRSNPKARFGVDTASICSNTPIVITNNSLGVPNIYYWDFGNGDTDTTFSNGAFSYTYNIGNVVDTFPLRLIAANECTRDTQMINVRVAPNIIRPQVTISGSELFGCVPHIVSFINATTGATSFTWDYGDGSPVDITNNVQTVVTHTFNTAGTFTVTVNISNGCSDTVIFKQVTVYAKPRAAFATNAAQYCLGDTIKVSNTSQDANNYRWFWGDGQSSSGFEPVHVYNTAGAYTILLRAERINSTGLVCLDTFVQNITVLVKPDVRVQSNIANPLCVPFTLNATAPGIINETVTWFITDTTVSPSVIIQSGINANYTFNKPGAFTVKMIASNAIGCNDSTELTFVVRGVPQASFTPNAITLCKADTTVSYQNTTTFNDFGPLTYQWLVDNAPQGINGNFTHRYTASGLLPQIFVTQLIATNSVGCTDTAIGTLQMNPNAKAQFVINNQNECPPFILSIGNVSQYATTYKWFLNNVQQDTAANPATLIQQPLTNYTITLIADNFFGCKPDTFSQSFTSRTKPKAAFAVNDTIGCTGNLNIVTTNTSIRANAYTWDWGDATAQTSFVSPTHLYNIQGQYIISLVASDATCKDTAYQTVYVSQKPVVDFSINDSVTCGTANVHFTNLTTGATNYLWAFSDNTTSNLFEPDKNFPPSPSYYTVKLEASNNLGCKDAAIKPNLILAKVPPAGDFVINPSPTISIPNYSFSFNNITLDDNNYTYRWDLGDGNFETTRDVVHKYNDTGRYEVQMIVFDNKNGCPDTTIKIARIEGQPGYLYVPNAFYPNSLQVQFKTFKPSGKGLAEYTFQVFDAWGKLLFQNSELDAAGSPVIGWDGNDMQTKKPMPQDAYAWRIVAKFRNGRQWDGMSYTNKREGSPGNTFGTVTLFR